MRDAADTVAASKNAGYTLTNTSLSSTDGMSLGLSGITTANLAATSAGKTFTVSGWTGSGSLTDTATGIVTASKNAGFTLTNTSLSSTDGMTLALSGITTANLTATATSGSPSYIVDASAFTGVTNLTAGGTVNAILFGGSANGSTLSATGSGNDVLIGGSGKDTLTDTGTGYNILIGGPGVDTITGNGNDILISGTTSYDSNTSANIAALDAILAEWSSSDSYSLRISKIMSGVGPAGHGRPQFVHVPVGRRGQHGERRNLLDAEQLVHRQLEGQGDEAGQRNGNHRLTKWLCSERASGCPCPGMRTG